MNEKYLEKINEIRECVADPEGYLTEDKPTEYVRAMDAFDDKFRAMSPEAEEVAFMYDNIKANLDYNPMSSITDVIRTLDGEELIVCKSRLERGEYDEPANISAKEALSNLGAGSEEFNAEKGSDMAGKKLPFGEGEIVDNFVKLADDIAKCDNAFERLDRTILALNDNPDIVNNAYMAERVIQRLYAKSLDELRAVDQSLDDYIENTSGKLLNHCKDLISSAGSIEEIQNITKGEVKDIQKCLRREIIGILAQGVEQVRDHREIKAFWQLFKDSPKSFETVMRMRFCEKYVKNADASMAIGSQSHWAMKELEKNYDSGELKMPQRAFVAIKSYHEERAQYSLGISNYFIDKYRDESIMPCEYEEFDEIKSLIGRHDFNETKDKKMNFEQIIIDNLVKISGLEDELKELRQKTDKFAQYY